MKDFRYILDIPFNTDGINIYDNHGECVASFITLDTDLINKIVAKINGRPIHISSVFRYADKTIYKGDIKVLVIKGMKYLRCDCLLNKDSASKIQDQLGEFFTNQLNKPC